MPEHTPTLEAATEIRAELLRLRARRALAFFLYVALISGGLLALLFLPKKPAALARDPVWSLSLVLLVGASAIAASAAIGFPLFRKRTVYTLASFAIAAMLAALLLVTNFDLASMDIRKGLACFLYCAVISGVAMSGLSLLGGRLWRRFPDPGLLLALAASGVGVIALHCGCDVSGTVHLFAFHLSPLILVFGMARAVIVIARAHSRERSFAQPKMLTRSRAR